MRTPFGFLTILILICACTPSGEDTQSSVPLKTPCETISHHGADYTVCTYKASEDDIRLFHSDAEGVPFYQFETLARELDEQGETLTFAMNGGMYHEDRRPVGFLRDDHGDQASVNTNAGPGNFHMQPNGVFWIDGDQAGISESNAFLTLALDPDYATQSGPMLVIDGALHPGINPDGTSRKRRNGVGVDADGVTVRFAISEAAVTFHDFATLFQGPLETQNALFLDGQVSRLYAPGLERREPGPDLGPIVGVVE